MRGPDRPLVGVLAIQGDFAEHLAVLERLGARTQAVRLPDQLDALDGLVIPGGESTTFGKLAVRYGFMQPIRDLVASGRPVWGTCAGLIFLSRDCGRDQPLLEVMDVAVRRNAFGSQVDSFECPLAVPALGPDPFPGVFIRAPLVTDCGKDVQVLAAIDAGVVAVEQGNLLGTCFHPELTSDPRIHRYFLNKIASQTQFPL